MVADAAIQFTARYRIGRPSAITPPAFSSWTAKAA
jgi:hypothetical protein